MGKPAIVLLLFSLISIAFISEAKLLIPPLLLSVVFIHGSGNDAGRTWKTFAFLQPLFLLVSLLMVLTNSEGRLLFQTGPLAITGPGLARGILLYLKLTVIFWISRAFILLWGREAFLDGLHFIFIPLRLIGGNPRHAAEVLHQAFLLFPSILRALPAFLKKGAPGFAELLRESRYGSLQQNGSTEPPDRKMFFYALVYSVTLLSIFILILGGA